MISLRIKKILEEDTMEKLKEAIILIAEEVDEVRDKFEY